MKQPTMEANMKIPADSMMLAAGAAVMAVAGLFIATMMYWPAGAPPSFWPDGITHHGRGPFSLAAANLAFYCAAIQTVWAWRCRRKANGLPGLDDPRSAKMRAAVKTASALFTACMLGCIAIVVTS